jgi:hypothetical protein
MPFLRYKNAVRTSQETDCVSTSEPNLLMLYKIWVFHDGDYEECLLLRFKNPVRSSQETHYVSAIEFSPLMLCKIWGFHGCDYEKCLLVGFKTPVCTSQETHYISATEPSRLMLCKIWGSDGGDYEECRLLGLIPHSIPRRKHIKSLLQNPTGECCVGFEVFIAVIMKNAVFWHMARFGLFPPWR